MAQKVGHYGKNYKRGRRVVSEWGEGTKLQLGRDRSLYSQEERKKEPGARRNKTVPVNNVTEEKRTGTRNQCGRERGKGSAEGKREVERKSKRTTVTMNTTKHSDTWGGKNRKGEKTLALTVRKQARQRR